MQSDRRKFLQYLAASSLFTSGVLGTGLAPAVLARSNEHYKQGVPGPIGDPAEALSVFDFEKVARVKLPPAHYGFLATGVDDEQTLRENRRALEMLQLRMRRLTGVTAVDTSVDLFGERWETPIVLAPTSSHSAFFPEGEVATAAAARAKSHLMILSTFASRSLAEVRAAYGAPFWFQLYAARDWGVTREMISRAEAVGCRTLVLTVDMAGGSHRETVIRFIRRDNRDCASCHALPPGPISALISKPTTRGLAFEFNNEMTWDDISKLKQATRMNLVIKGIVTAEDARLCIEHGADGIIVSNHGGRAAESGRATIDCLPEIVAAVDDDIPVLIDSGFRRGTDVFKAIALGAKAVCIGRPYLWGLASFGQPGVETVLALLRAELELIMRKAGTASLADINPDYITGRT
jgi:isopentenyl diphosphate isomerase/L-lactate dehydrogenase-like FMN-dependent dehydrogenase